MTKNTVRSHYLPRTYLKHFLLDDALFMYKKGERFFEKEATAESRILRVKSEEGLANVGLENNLYAIEAPGVSSNDIEEIFQEYGESFLDDLITKIEARGEGDSITGEIKDKLCTFLAAMRVRTPLFKYEAEEMSASFTMHSMAKDMEHRSVEELKAAIDAEGKSYTEEQIASARQAFIDKKYKLKFPNALFLKLALSSLDMHADIFHGMNMLILRSKADRYFITSDNPVVYFVPREKINFYNPPKSLMSPHTEVFFALTRNLAVHLSRAKLKEIIMRADHETVDVFNYNISFNSFNFIFSPLQIKSLEQFSKEYIPYPFRVVTR